MPKNNLIVGIRLRINYLVIGTGNPWAWQNKARAVLLGFLNELVPESVEKVGGLDPMGSNNVIIK